MRLTGQVADNHLNFQMLSLKKLLYSPMAALYFSHMIESIKGFELAQSKYSAITGHFLPQRQILAFFSPGEEVFNIYSL